MKNLNESYNDFLLERQKQTPQQVDASKRMRLKEANDAAKDMMKKKPAKAAYYKAKLDYIAAQIKVLDAYKKVLAAKKSLK